MIVTEMTRSSPHTRGWSQQQVDTLKRDMVFPAYAGVVPQIGIDGFIPIGLPRIRGGGPS